MGAINKVWLGPSHNPRDDRSFLAIRCNSSMAVSPVESLSVSVTTLPPLKSGMGLTEATEKGLQQDHVGINYLTREDLVTLRDALNDFLNSKET